MFSLGKLCKATSISMCRPSVCCSLSSDNCGGDRKGGNDDNMCPVCRCPGDYNPSSPTMYDSRKYGHFLPSSTVLPFEPLPNIPTGIFRCTAGEVLGRGAAKGAYYQNPEYFSFQHMSYYDLHLILRGCRRASPKTGRKP